MPTESNPPDEAARRKQVLAFIQSQKLGVLCTISQDGLPQAATMAISQTDNLELIFQTPNTSRKYANLQHDPHIAVVMGWSIEDFTTLQYEGIAREVTDDAERARCAAIHDGKKGPGAPLFRTLWKINFLWSRPPTLDIRI